MLTKISEHGDKSRYKFSAKKMTIVYCHFWHLRHFVTDSLTISVMSPWNNRIFNWKSIASLLLNSFRLAVATYFFLLFFLKHQCLTERTSSFRGALPICEYMTDAGLVHFIYDRKGEKTNLIDFTAVLYNTRVNMALLSACIEKRIKVNWSFIIKTELLLRKILFPFKLRGNLWQKH